MSAWDGYKNGEHVATYPNQSEADSALAARTVDSISPALTLCDSCGVYTSNGPNHSCVAYDGPRCRTCAEPTVFVTISAPGTGQGWVCKAGHYHGTSRILTVGEVR